MKAVYKYEIQITDDDYIQMPKGAKIIKFGKQGNEYYVWAIVDPQANIEMRIFHIVGTGNPLNDSFWVTHKHIDSWIESDGGQFVWHLFEFLR